jgi:hypothetical protein
LEVKTTDKGGLTMNKKQQQREDILRHGFNLQRIYPETKHLGPVELCKKLHRMEVSASRMAEEMCNLDADHDAALDRIEKRVNDLLGGGPQVFINTDPRGYALKISTEDAKGLDIHKDWGGYGIICPEY